MLALRPYKSTDADTILSWCTDEKTFYKWSAGRLGKYPASVKEFSLFESMMPFVAFDESGIVGFFTLRNIKENPDELRFGFIIVNPEKRGMGYGKEMLKLGLKFVFEIYKAKKASLGVFENNSSAYHCYISAGFKEDEGKFEIYHLMGEDWKCLDLIIEQ